MLWTHLWSVVTKCSFAADTCLCAGNRMLDLWVYPFPLPMYAVCPRADWGCVLFLLFPVKKPTNVFLSRHAPTLLVKTRKMLIFLFLWHSIKASFLGAQRSQCLIWCRDWTPPTHTCSLYDVGAVIFHVNQLPLFTTASVGEGYVM